MRFTSSVCPERQSSQELIVLCHGEERVLVPMPNTYEVISPFLLSQNQRIAFDSIETGSERGCRATFWFEGRHIFGDRGLTRT